MGIGEELAKNFLVQLDNLREKLGDSITVGDIDGLFKHIRSDERDTLYDGIQKIADKINLVKVEIFSPHPDQLAGDIIPDANLELDAVIKAAEDATHQILDSVEIIQLFAEKLDEESQNKMLDEITKIFEACNFQDVTGQRVTKVLKTLEEIDASVNELMEAISDKVTIHAKKRQAEDFEASLMSGPQLEEAAPSQDDIDKLFADA